MEFGLFTHIPWPEGADPGRVAAEGKRVGELLPLRGFRGRASRFLGYARNDMGAGDGRGGRGGAVGGKHFPFCLFRLWLRF